MAEPVQSDTESRPEKHGCRVSKSRFPERLADATLTVFQGFAGISWDTAPNLRWVNG
jgi:hypothetical protein